MPSLHLPGPRWVGVAGAWALLPLSEAGSAQSRTQALATAPGEGIGRWLEVSSLPPWLPAQPCPEVPGVWPGGWGDAHRGRALPDASTHIPATPTCLVLGTHVPTALGASSLLLSQVPHTRKPLLGADPAPKQPVLARPLCCTLSAFIPMLLDSQSATCAHSHVFARLPSSCLAGQATGQWFPLTRMVGSGSWVTMARLSRVQASGYCPLWKAGRESGGKSCKAAPVAGSEAELPPSPPPPKAAGTQTWFIPGVPTSIQHQRLWREAGSSPQTCNNSPWGPTPPGCARCTETREPEQPYGPHPRQSPSSRARDCAAEKTVLFLAWPSSGELWGASELLGGCWITAETLAWASPSRERHMGDGEREMGVSGDESLGVSLLWA